MTLDVSEVTGLARDLGRVQAAVVPAVEAVMKKAAQNVRDEWARHVDGSARLVHLPRALSYDRAFTVGGVEYEVGYDKDRRQGALGNIAEYGTSKHGPVRPGAAAALARESSNLDKYLGDVAAGLL